MPILKLDKIQLGKIENSVEIESPTNDKYIELAEKYNKELLGINDGFSIIGLVMNEDI